MKYKIVKYTSYGGYSLESWRKLTLEQALKLKKELEQLNPDDVYDIKEQR